MQKIEESKTALLADISVLRAEKSALESEISIKQEENEIKRIDRDKIEKGIEEIEERVKKLEDNYEEKKISLTAELNAIEDGKREDWEKREGDISEKTVILSKKEDELRKLKLELEIFYNRKFNNINI